MIETERLVLREPRRDDDLTDWIADAEVQRWIGVDHDAAEVIERWMRRWERNGLGQFAVELDGTYWGKGYATKAALAARALIERRVDTPHAVADVWVHPR